MYIIVLSYIYNKYKYVYAHHYDIKYIEYILTYATKNVFYKFPLPKTEFP